MGEYSKQSVLRFVTHSKRVIEIAKRYGWLPGARYTNLRDIRGVERVGLLDVDWKRYDFKRHLEAVKATRPFMTVAKDIVLRREISTTLDQAGELSLYADHVVIVPKDPELAADLEQVVPEDFILGYSVPSSYGGTQLPPTAFKRPVHLLGGRPDIQRQLGKFMPVFSFDCNRFTFDAEYGDYFDGETFRPHPIGGYERCIEDSVRNINALWDSYDFHGV